MRVGDGESNNSNGFSLRGRVTTVPDDQDSAIERKQLRWQGEHRPAEEKTGE